MENENERRRLRCSEHNSRLTDCFELHHPELVGIKRNAINNDPEFMRLLAEETHLQRQQENEKRKESTEGPKVNGKKKSQEETLPD